MILLLSRVIRAVLLVGCLTGACAVQAQTFSVVYNFANSDGFGPMAGVVQGTDGALYGTTSQGGAAGLGTVFRFDRSAGSLNTLHSFNGGDGSTLYSGLAQGNDGALYGSTFDGGALNLGTLFRVGTTGANFVSLYSFSGPDGENPDDLKLVKAADGSFYGATSAGGTYGGGTIFRLDPATGALTTLYNFAETAGVDAGLVAGRDGKLYGTTYSGGANAAGSVFSIDPATFTLTTLHDFGGTGGSYPVPGALLHASDGYLYGSTQLGGNGTVYRLNPSTLAFTTLHTFSGTTDGRMPLGGLTEGGDGYVYGTTVLGGQGYGTVYRVNMTTLAYNIAVRFGNSNGRSPSGNLYRVPNGPLYGATRLGGLYNAGTIYRISTDTTAPVISAISASPNTLKPASGKMVAVKVSVSASDNLDPAPISKITAVTCNQTATSDWQITGDLSLNLRAKKTGGAKRIYTITVTTTDASGNAATATTTVTVP